jgi:hypothetical protein
VKCLVLTELLYNSTQFELHQVTINKAAVSHHEHEMLRGLEAHEKTKMWWKEEDEGHMGSSYIPHAIIHIRRGWSSIHRHRVRGKPRMECH